MVEHEHAELPGVLRQRDGMKEGGVHGRDDDLRWAAESSHHDLGEPGGDDDLLERQPVGRVDARGEAVVEALVVLDEVELGPAPGGRLRHWLR